ncbi:MAG: TRAP transporter TatT component family protein [Candidatus Latescibacterota bacterium]|nr:TRAP transporter TatT component family protein [Candidatus Latescibacterota bacterium]
MYSFILAKYRFRVKKCTLFIIVCVISFGCANRIKQSIVAGVVEDFTAATRSHTDPLLIEQALPPLLLAIDAFLIDEPKNIKLLIQATEAYASYGALVEMRDPQRSMPIYARAHRYGKRALEIHLKQIGIHSLPFTDFEKTITKLNRNDLNVVYWCATAWGGWINSNLHSMNAIAELPKVILMMKWVINTDETFNNGSAHLFLGVFYSALPVMLGGDPLMARHHFEKNIDLTDNQSLLPYVFMAEYYTRQIFDRKLHDELLNYVVEQNISPNSSNTLENKIAQHRAHLLLDNADDFF